MAKIDFVTPATGKKPALTETVEVRVWGTGGKEEQNFSIGGAVNFQANNNYWVEIRYEIAGEPLFYTRNFLHLDRSDEQPGIRYYEKQLDKILKRRKGRFVLRGGFPETGLECRFRTGKTEDETDEQTSFSFSELVISADTGFVYNDQWPGAHTIQIRLNMLDTEQAVSFLRDLLGEIEAAHQGSHPDPACFPEGSSEWPLISQINRRAYNQVQQEYNQAYFDNPLLVEAFDGWLAQLTPGTQVLDVGCGHGEPVIARLLEKGFQVTGSDIAPEMLSLARQRFPQAAFLQQTSTAINSQAAFDGICSFHSLLYLDPIDLLHSIRRMHHALKPNGLLFLLAFEPNPNVRGDPFAVQFGQWMWNWHYGMDEAACLLQEHGYFEVLETRRVEFNEAEEQRVAEEIEKQRQEEEMEKLRAEDEEESSNDDLMDFIFKLMKPPSPSPHFPPYAYVVTARRRERQE